MGAKHSKRSINISTEPAEGQGEEKCVNQVLETTEDVKSDETNNSAEKSIDPQACNENKVHENHRKTKKFLLLRALSFKRNDAQSKSNKNDQHGKNDGRKTEDETVPQNNDTTNNDNDQLGKNDGQKTEDETVPHNNDVTNNDNDQLGKNDGQKTEDETVPHNNDTTNNDNEQLGKKDGQKTEEETVPHNVNDVDNVCKNDKVINENGCQSENTANVIGPNDKDNNMCRNDEIKENSFKSFDVSQVENTVNVIGPNDVSAETENIQKDLTKMNGEDNSTEKMDSTIVTKTNVTIFKLQEEKFSTKIETSEYNEVTCNFYPEELNGAGEGLAEILELNETRQLKENGLDQQNLINPREIPEVPSVESNTQEMIVGIENGVNVD